MKKATKFSPKVRERTMHVLFEQRDQHGSQWAKIESIAAKNGCSAQAVVELGAAVRGGLRPA